MKRFDFQRAENFKQDICNRGFNLLAETTGPYNRIIQEYTTTETWENLTTIKELLDKKYDTNCTIFGGNGIHYLEAQFYPV
jgi:hypothetical protein